VDCIVVYKVDRLSRSLLDFARIIEVFDRHGVSFVAVTQQFNTTSSLGRLTLNILLSFAQFEREIISERTRDKMSAARRKPNGSAAIRSSGMTSILRAAGSSSIPPKRSRSELSLACTSRRAQRCRSFKKSNGSVS
jgi:hypothetical protein